MSKRKVKLHFSLVGKTRSSLLSKEFGNSGVLESVEDQIKSQFGERPVFISDRERVILEGRQYPEYYAAGWFISQSPLTDTDGVGSELVVVAHGENMADARANVMSAIEKSSWESLARNL